MLGWIFDVTFLKSILPDFVTMKFITAFCFVLCGAELYFTARVVEDGSGWDSLILLFNNFLVALIMLSLVIALFFGIETGLEDLFVQEPVGAINTVVPGRPAFLSAVNFILISLVSSLSLFGRGRSVRFINILGAAVAAVGGVAVVGYLFDIPALYYNISEISTAMALNTAILFVLLGSGFYMIRGGDGLNQG